MCVVPSHNWLKISSNQADFLQTYREVNRIPGNTYWVYSVKGFRRYGTSKLKKYFENFPMLFSGTIQYFKTFCWINECTDETVERTSTQYISFEAHWQGLTGGLLKQKISWGQWPWEGQMSDFQQGHQKYDGKYLGKRYEIESSYQQKTIIKLHISFPKKVKYLTFDDPERSRSLMEILDAEYLANGTR